MPAEEPALVERGDELSSLVRALLRPPGIVLVEGELGVGKSRLVRAALTDPALAGRPWSLGRARPVRDPGPLGPVIEALAAMTMPPARVAGPRPPGPARPPGPGPRRAR